jgi:hypothetical protein
LEDEKELAAKCVDSLIASENGLSKSKELEFMYFNSNDRFLRYIQISDKLSGYVSDVEDSSISDFRAKWR